MGSEEFLAILEKLTGIAPHISKQRGATLEFDGRFDVTIELPEFEERAYFHAPILSLTKNDRDSIFAHALQTQMFFLATEGNAFGYDMKGNCLILFRVLDLPNLSSESLIESIDSFVNQVERWAHYFSNLSADVVCNTGSVFNFIGAEFK